MTSSLDTALISAVIALCSTVVTLALYIWRQEVGRRKSAEAKLLAMREPGEATVHEAHLLRYEMERLYGGADDWPWPADTHPRSTRAPRPRTRRRPR